MPDTQTLTLAEFLLARIAEDEAVARRVTEAINADPGSYASIVLGHPELAAGDCPSYLADYDPARALAECEAKRRIVVTHQPAIDQAWQDGESKAVIEYLATRTLALFALPYADHEDFREEWRP